MVKNSMDIGEWKYNVYQFLAGTFHQDCGDIDDAIEEYLNRQNTEWLIIYMGDLRQFINEEISDDEKELFITKSAEIYFPLIEMSPLEWFQSIITRMEEELSKR